MRDKKALSDWFERFVLACHREKKETGVRGEMKTKGKK